MKKILLFILLSCSLIHAQEYDIKPGLKLDSTYRNGSSNENENYNSEEIQPAPYQDNLNYINSNKNDTKKAPNIYTTSTENNQKTFTKKTYRGPPGEEKEKRTFRSFRFRVRENQKPLTHKEKPRTFKDMVERYQK